MENRYPVLGFIFASLALFGCISTDGFWPAAQGGVVGGVVDSGGTYPGVSEAPLYTAERTVQYDKMIIKTGSAEVEVPAGTLKERYALFKEKLRSYEGEITDSSYFENPAEKYYLITVRLNPKKFDDFGLALADIGTVKHIISQSQDVTTQYIDIDARLENLKATRERVLALYNRTGNISEILQIENELNRLQYEIDIATQEKLYYERQSAKATMSVRLVEPAPAVDQTLFTPLGQLLNIFLGGVVFSATLIAGVLGFAIPLAIVLGICYLLLRILAFRKR